MAFPAEGLAAIARRIYPAFAERLAFRADAVSQALARELMLVGWDREQLIGAMQERLASMTKAASGRNDSRESTGARVLELRRQPLEAIEATWECLLRGNPVVFGSEAGACTAAAELIAELAALLPSGALAAVDAAAFAAHAWPLAGVTLARPRIAVIDAAADRELAAYTLARACLRRGGVDPRRVAVAYVVGPTDLLKRQLHRLWVGAQLGPADDPESFAGPVDAATREAFVAAQQAWRADERVQSWCEGGLLEGAHDDVPLLAPAAFACDWPLPAHPLVGPMCCVVRCSEEQAQAAIREAVAARVALIVVGGRPLDVPTEVKHIRGAVLVERLPPGLPEPRPV